MSGEMLWERSDIEDLADTSCGKVRKGWPDGKGGFVFWACQAELVFLADKAATHASVVASPTYTEELPNQRDIDRFIETLASMGSIGGARRHPRHSKCTRMNSRRLRSAGFSRQSRSNSTSKDASGWRPRETGTGILTSICGVARPTLAR